MIVTEHPTLHELQVLHTELTAKLIAYAILLGYEVTWGETLRSKQQAQANAATGVGIANSLHEFGLAVDLNLFKDGKYLTDSQDHAPFGHYWKNLHPLCRWGGDFRDKDGRPKPDGNHYSIEYRGIK